MCSGDIAQGLADLTGLVADKRTIDGPRLDNNRELKDDMWNYIYRSKQLNEFGEGGDMLGCSATG